MKSPRKSDLDRWKEENPWMIFREGDRVVFRCPTKEEAKNNAAEFGQFLRIDIASKKVYVK